MTVEDARKLLSEVPGEWEFVVFDPRQERDIRVTSVQLDRIDEKAVVRVDG
jgi:hypothetical protein